MRTKRSGAAILSLSEFDSAKLKKIAAKLGGGVDAAWLAARSPIRPGDWTRVSFFQALYRPGEAIVIRAAGEPCEVWFLINPVAGELALGGHESECSVGNVTSWRYLLLEFGRAESFDWLAALVQMPLPTGAPTALSLKASLAITALAMIPKISELLKNGGRCPICGYVYNKDTTRWRYYAPNNRVAHRYFHHQHVPAPEPLIADFPAGDIKVDTSSPAWLHKLVYERARYLQRQEHYDFVQWDRGSRPLRRRVRGRHSRSSLDRAAPHT